MNHPQPLTWVKINVAIEMFLQEIENFRMMKSNVNPYGTISFASAAQPLRQAHNDLKITLTKKHSDKDSPNAAFCSIGRLTKCRLDETDCSLTKNATTHFLPR